MRSIVVALLGLALAGCASQPPRRGQDAALLKAAQHVLCANTRTEQRAALALAANRNEPVAEEERSGAIAAFVEADCRAPATVLRPA